MAVRKVSSEAKRRRTSKARKKGTRSLVAVWVVACLAATLTLATIGTVEPGRALERPNIVYVVVDDFNSYYLKRLPRLDSLMTDKGTTFSNAFATTSLCCPSRASVLTGRYVHNHGVTSNNAPFGGFERFRELGLQRETVAVRLRASGYRTVLIGKYLNQYTDTTHVPPGWGRWYGLLGQNSDKLNENGKIVRYERAMTDVFRQKAVSYIRQSEGSGRPFFMYLAPNAPHTGSTVPQRYQDRFRDVHLPRPPSFNEKDVSDKPTRIRSLPPLGEPEIDEMRRTYREGLRSMLAVEDMLAGVLDALRQTGQLRNTYVVFTSDHGVHNGQHRLPHPNGKGRPYEEDIGVPFVVRGPGVPKGATRPEMVLNIDFASTFVDMADAGRMTGADGRSILPLVHGNTPASWRRAFLVEQHYPKGKPAYAAVRTRGAIYVEHEDASGSREFYLLGKDPYQLESLHATADPDLLASMQGTLRSLKECAGSECRAAENSASP